ncbi:Mss4-like protein [Lophiotrema nucula]|uniref:Mss4-like protein n=1 Tax=Lophiotrema nucula TaxID=690887 RepID=A0A6A5YG11_9PLEO|nr:Mss4-like protein [Lophiotrema nucula]
MPGYKDLTVSCLCGAARHTFTVPETSLPLLTNLCNCNISRRISGSLVTSYFDITLDESAPKPNVSALTGYKSSNMLTRYFCSTCGTQMYLEYNSNRHFWAATGTLEVENTDGILEWNSQMWIEDTLDGGASEFLTSIKGRTLNRYFQEARESKEAPSGWRDSSGASSQPGTEQRVRARCHCNGVEFYISRPNNASNTATESAWPDLLVADPTGMAENPENFPWWLAGHNRYMAGTCACTTCRRSSGFEITFWAFLPTANITQDAEGTVPFQRKPYWGTMNSFQSSPGVTRTFCGICGANVFWDGKDTLIDVAAGLLDATSGARAEEWLAWWPERVSFAEKAQNKELIAGLEEGLKKWAHRNEGASFVATRTFPVCKAVEQSIIEHTSRVLL